MPTDSPGTGVPLRRKDNRQLEGQAKGGGEIQESPARLDGKQGGRPERTKISGADLRRL